MNYYKRIRDLREDNDKTQQEIADYLETSQTMYARYERGANELPIRHLIKLADYYFAEPIKKAFSWHLKVKTKGFIFYLSSFNCFLKIKRNIKRTNGPA